MKRKFGAWVTGCYEGQSFSAKVFNEGSPFGINGGRVSKLFWGNIQYDREWVSPPLEEDFPMYNRLMDQLENLQKEANTERVQFPNMDVYN